MRQFWDSRYPTLMGFRRDTPIRDLCRREAIKRFGVWCDKWQVEAERAVRCMRKDLQHCLLLLCLSQGLVEEDSHHQRTGAGFPGSQTENQTNGFLPSWAVWFIDIISTKMVLWIKKYIPVYDGSNITKLLGIWALLASDAGSPDRLYENGFNDMRNPA